MPDVPPPPAEAPERVVATAVRWWHAGVARNIVVLGLVSCLTDMGGDLIYPLVPLFLTTVLGAPVAAIGLIEGVAEGTASVMKAGSGWWSDRLDRRLPAIAGGYGLGTLGKLLLALAPTWPLALLARFVDRFGKGMRGSPRDALIADSAPPEQLGRAFGVHRTLETSGAVIGPLLGLGLVALLSHRLRLVIGLAVIPAALSLLALAWVHEPPKPRDGPRRSAPTFRVLRGLDRQVYVFLVASLVFALGNSSDVFLLLRAKNLGLSTTAVVLAYAVYNFVFMGASLPAGMLSDRRSRQSVFLVGLVVFAVVYAGFAVVQRGVVLWPLFAVYGLYLALTDGVSRALVSELAPADRRASILGVYGMLTGLAALLASVVAGQLWDHVSPAAPFLLGAGGATIAALLLAALRPRAARYASAGRPPLRS